MIFATVGSMLPFDRFVQAVDTWAGANPGTPVFLQIGEGAYEPRHAEFVRVMPQADYRARLRACRLFVAHAGMGSILQALEDGKQTLLLPRRHALGEHTTDHQLHTAARFKDTPGLMIAEDEVALQAAMSRLLDAPLATGPAISAEASPELIGKVKSFLDAARAR